MENTKKNAVFKTALEPFGGIVGGGGGNRTRVRKPSTGSSTYLVRLIGFDPGTPAEQACFGRVAYCLAPCKATLQGAIPCK